MRVVHCLLSGRVIDSCLNHRFHLPVPTMRAGGPLHIGFHLEPGYSVANCLASHDELRLRNVR